MTSASGTRIPQCSSSTVTKSTSAKLSSAPLLKRSRSTATCGTRRLATLLFRNSITGCGNDIFQFPSFSYCSDLFFHLSFSSSIEQKPFDRRHESSTVGARPSSAAPVVQNHSFLQRWKQCNDLDKSPSI